MVPAFDLATAKALSRFPLEPIGENAYHLRSGDRGAPTLIFCGSMRFEEPSLHALLQLMPTVMLVRGAVRGRETAVRQALGA